MATATVIDFGSHVSPSSDERVQSKWRSPIELSEFVDARCDRCTTEFEGIVGPSPALRAVVDQVQTVAPTDATVLILWRNRNRKRTGRPGHSRTERP